MRVRALPLLSLCARTLSSTSDLVQAKGAYHQTLPSLGMRHDVTRSLRTQTRVRGLGSPAAMRGALRHVASPPSHPAQWRGFNRAPEGIEHINNKDVERGSGSGARRSVGGEDVVGAIMLPQDEGARGVEGRAAQARRKVHHTHRTRTRVSRRVALVMA